MEEWRVVAGYSDYEVSDMGRVRSWRKGNRVVPRKEAKILKGVNQQGYRSVDLFDGYGVPKAWRVHRLVCRAFLENPKERPHVNHKNFDRADNRLENLEWCTPQENISHAKAAGKTNGGHKASEINGGKRHPKAKISLADAKAIKRLLADGHKQKDIAEKYGISRVAVADIKRGRTWGHA